MASECRAHVLCKTELFCNYVHVRTNLKRGGGKPHTITVYWYMVDGTIAERDQGGGGYLGEGSHTL